VLPLGLGRPFVLTGFDGRRMLLAHPPDQLPEIGVPDQLGEFDPRLQLLGSRIVRQFWLG
jgi:hypothetical protein